ncbi:MAG: hypothetical protein EOO39_06605 [Cytophagaceae bacterium]|nr:MAG: hypothetical protein EOO39_06605 [Cytophagaceae bacterium]
MKTCFALLIALLASLVGHTQDTIPLYSDVIARQKSQLRPSIGLDLFQAVWFLDSPNPTELPTRFTHPVSITLYIPDKRLNHAGRARYINVGYVAYGGTLQRNIYQKGSSVHLRMGIEHTRRTLIYGYGGLIAGWTGQASFLFTGTTFGDYMQSIGTRSGLAVGGEGHLGVFIPFSNRLSLRTTVRASVLGKMGNSNSNNLPAPHLSGIDWQSEKQAGMGLSLQANLVFRL